MCAPRLRNFLNRFLRLAVAAAALVQGCAVQPPAEVPREVAAAPPPAFPVPDGRWELVTSTFIGVGRIPGVPRATLLFEGGRMSAFSGCNTASATVHHADGRLEVAALAATRRSCPEPLGTFEARFFKLLRSRPVYRPDGDSLTLLDGEHSARFRRLTEGPAGGAAPGFWREGRMPRWPIPAPH